MKCWFIWAGKAEYCRYDGWGDYVHGKNISEAKKMFWEAWNGEIDSWIDMSPQRIPVLDNIPITRESIMDQQGIEPENKDFSWYPVCDCEVCKT